MKGEGPRCRQHRLGLPWARRPRGPLRTSSREPTCSGPASGGPAAPPQDEGSSPSGHLSFSRNEVRGSIQATRYRLQIGEQKTGVLGGEVGELRTQCSREIKGNGCHLLAAYVGALVSARKSMCYMAALTRQGLCSFRDTKATGPFAHNRAVSKCTDRWTDGRTNDLISFQAAFMYVGSILWPDFLLTLVARCHPSLFHAKSVHVLTASPRPARPRSPKSGTQCPRGQGPREKGRWARPGRSHPGGRASAGSKAELDGLRPGAGVAPSASGF